MNGAHDLGGMHGFGPVVREKDEPVFHAEWERTVFGLSQAVRPRTLFNVDEFRHSIERLPPVQYLGSSYYERWLAGIEQLLTEKGVVERDELDARIVKLRADPQKAPSPTIDPDSIERIRASSRRRPSYERDGPAPRFVVGQHVVARNVHPRGHTRLPRYARGKRGIVHRVHGSHVFPDSNAQGLGEQPQPLYSVRFEATELWSDSAEPNQSVYLDLWESYLQPSA